ncbi:MAG TPA: o-succinylbenzoate synthase, partial [Gemmataceae bacterium]|nr:o-succinylbenzoate synthase [Gemmataceae bacterium]
VVESVLVRLDGGGLSGWGEASPLGAPTYSPEWAAGAFHVLRTWLAPRLVGRGVASGAQLQQMLAVVKGNPFAKAGLDLAWWDLHARHLGQPLYRLLGGADPTVTVGADFGVQDRVEELLAKVAEALETGFPRVKLKFRPGWDLPVVRAVRRAFPDAVLHIDCNAGYRLEDAPLFRELDALGLAMYEQPLAHDDLLDHAALQRQVRTPVCLDESITSADKARQALQLGSCRYVNVKPGRVGGLTNAIAVHDLCRAQGVPCWVGGMLESAVGAAHCIALATLPGFTYPADIFPSRRFYRQDLAEPEVVLAGAGQVRALDLPGIGTAPEPERLARLTVEHAEILP